VGENDDFQSLYAEISHKLYAPATATINHQIASIINLSSVKQSFVSKSGTGRPHA